MDSGSFIGNEEVCLARAALLHKDLRHESISSLLSFLFIFWQLEQYI